MDLYEILQVTEEATRAEIRAAYLVLVQESHPDRRNVDPALAELASEARFKRIQEAFETLHDPARRAAYDRTRGRPVVHRGHVVVTPTGTGFRRDIPTQWLHRSGSTRRPKRRLGRWILLALVVAMVAALFSLPHFFWPKLSSRAADASPAARSAPRAAQLAVSPPPADEMQHAVAAIDTGNVPPGTEPHRPSEEADRADVTVGESATDLLPVASSSKSSWHPSSVEAAVASLATVQPFLAEWRTFEPAIDDPEGLLQAWQLEHPLPALSDYPPPTRALLPDSTFAPLPINAHGHELLDALMAGAPDTELVQWYVDDVALVPLSQLPPADEMSIQMVRDPPPLDDMVFPDSYAAMWIDPVEPERPVNVPSPAEPTSVPNTSGRRPPVLPPLTHRQKNRATNKWETFPWSASDSRLGPRASAPLTFRRQTSSRQGLETMNRSLSGAVRWPTAGGTQPADAPQNVSQAFPRWPPSPAKADLPTTGIRSGPVGLNRAIRADSAPLSPLPHLGDRFYFRHELGPYDSP